MRLMRLVVKVWALLCVAGLIAIGIALSSNGHGMTVNVGDDFFDGTPAALAGLAIGALAIFILGLAATLVIGIVGVIVSCILTFALVAVLLGLGAAGVALFGGLLVAISPVLILAAACGLLVRAIRRRRVAAGTPIPS